MLTVGFDLDMTLVDSRPGIRASMDALAQETGVPIDVDVVIARSARSSSGSSRSGSRPIRSTR